MNFIKYLIVLILIYNIGDLKAIENKIAFTVENEIYTSIDLENRKKYLQSIRLTQNIGTDLEIIEDYITTILFYLENNKKDMNLLDEAEKLYNKIKEDFDLVDNKDEFKKNFYSLDKRIYIEYLNYDLNRRKIIEKYKESLAISLCYVINILDPDAIVFGGGVSNEITFFDEVKKKIEKQLKVNKLNTAFIKPMYGDASGVRGAARLGRKINY